MASRNIVSSESDQVLVQDRQFVRSLILNRPKQLNALSNYMVSRLLELCLTYEEDPSVKLVLLKGNGRAFCAGGDVSAVVRDITEGGDWRLGADYFRKEFTLNFVMATYKKPQVSILNGIVMGGGAGASFHGRFRIVTENTKLSLLEEELCEAKLDDPLNICKIFDKYAEQPVLKVESAYRKLHIIDKCFSHRTVEEILSSLENESAERNDDWISAAIESLKKASPTSLKISLKSIREGRLQGVGQCLVREYRMVCHVMRGEVSKDFFEGCRAILIDKDKNPKWNPSRLDQVSDNMVNHYFTRVDDEEWMDLKFPPRSNFPASAMAKL